jgi:hypothetical protein
MVVTRRSSSWSVLDSVSEESPFRTKTIIGRKKSQSFQNVSDLSSATDEDDDDDDGYDFGPLLRFNLYVADTLYRYTAAKEEEDRMMMLDKIRYLISAVGAGPVCARDSVVRHNVFRYVRSGPNMDLATDVIKRRGDVRALTRHGIRSPAFVRHHHQADVPFDLVEKTRVHRQVLDVIRNSSRPTNKTLQDANADLHRMWERLDPANHRRKKPPTSPRGLLHTVRICWCCALLSFLLSVSVAVHVAVFFREKLAS